MIFFDTESVGSNGPLVLIQYDFGDGIYIDKVWDQSVNDTLDTIECLVSNMGGVCGFNISHDWFQLTKWYNIFKKVSNKDGPPSISEIRRIEERGPQYDDLCLKPVRACDLMLLSRTTIFQYLAKHKPVRIKKVPTVMLRRVIDRLSEIQLPIGVSCNWRISEERQYRREDVKDILGDFKTSTSLKSLASVILKRPEITRQTFQSEVGDIPYNEPPSYRPWGGDWVRGLEFFKYKIYTNPSVLTYAANDIVYLKELYKVLGEPPGGDDDSELACLVGATHWKGFAITSVSSDFNRLGEKYRDRINRFKGQFNINSPNEVLDYIHSFLSPIEQLGVLNTKRTTLEELARWNHPVAEVVELIQESRQAVRRQDLLRKLLSTNSFHFSMKVIGTLSSRMSGGSDIVSTDGLGKKLNPQGIPHEKEIRELFTLAYPGEQLSGGDFDAFEVTILDAVVHDPQLHADLISGEKIHAVTGSEFYQNSYEEILATKGLVDSKYNRIKNTFFAWIYGASIQRIAKTANVEESFAELGVKRWKERYPQIYQHREKLYERFTPVKQLGEGNKVDWCDPNEYIESIMGFRRYFTLEWAILRGIYETANSPPGSWDLVNGSIRRTNREQSMSGATRSALFGSLFGQQGYVFRAAANHEIQSPGAQITKRLQRNIWELQPVGINPWKVRPFNVHDEVLVCSTTLTHPLIVGVVHQTISQLQQVIPLLSISWKEQLQNWSDK